MASLIDVPVEKFDSAKLSAELASDVPGAADTATKPKEPAAADTGKKSDGEDPRFAGKSAEELLTMYRNLESHTGSLANQLGQTRKTLDELLLAKRSTDLNANGGKAEEIDPTVLLTRPQEVIGKYVQTTTQQVIEPLQQKISQLEAALANNSFTSRHSDVNAVTADPAFKAWVAKTPLRQQLAQSAAQGNLQAADALLTEFKELKAAQPKTGGHLEAALDAASKTALEGTSSSEPPTGATTGKVYRRSDLIALRMRNPDEYERLAPQIERAYREGRVR